MEERQALLRAAQDAIRRGERRQARTLLTQAARENPQDYRIWLLLAGIAGSPRASLDYIARAERLQPGHPTITRARAWAEQQLAATPAPERRSAAPAPAVPRSDRVASVPFRGSRSRWRRNIARAAIAAMLLLLASVAAGWAWNQRPPAQRPAAAVAELEPTPIPPTATEAATARVARGGFLPRTSDDSAATPAATTTPLAISVHRKVSQPAGTPRPTWTVTPSPTPTPTPTPTLVPTFVSQSSAPQPVLRPEGVGPDERWIDVNLTQQRLVAYEGDTPVFDTLVSSGTWNHPTVTGQFRVWLRFTSQTMDGRRLGYNYYLENVPYVMYFYQDYALHGTFWHNNFGTPMSHGCVNLPTPAAEWIFNWSSIGTVVNVHY
jgi:lipoprotein-anchoring transpeptidase ErfK/SrfK